MASAFEYLDNIWGYFIDHGNLRDLRGSVHSVRLPADQQVSRSAGQQVSRSAGQQVGGGAGEQTGGLLVF